MALSQGLISIKTEYAWIRFEQKEEYESKKTKVFFCYNKENNTCLGIVKWHGGFRKYSFFPGDKMVFEETCLNHIAHFLNQLMLQRKISRQAGK